MQVVPPGAQASECRFVLTPRARLIDEHGALIDPASGRTGRLAVPPPGPLGYYKDEAKSAGLRTEIDGVTYTVPGDYAYLNARGEVVLLGRGALCINTGGEKVYPEEVEEVLKTHGGVADAVAVGLPDEKFGEAITAVVELVPGVALDEGDIIAHVKGKLAAYKAPKRVLSIDTIGRAPNGKVDYKRLKSWAADQVEAP
jgi:fatty-acyl-CoA synthase